MTASGSLSGVTTTLSGGRSGMSSSATVIATVPKSAAICSSAPGSAAHSRPNGSRGRKCRFCQGTKARPHSAPSVMMAAGMNRSWLEFGRGVPVRPQRVRKRPATFRRARARLPLGSLRREVSSIISTSNSG